MSQEHAGKRWRVDAEQLGGGLRLSVYDDETQLTFEQYFQLLEIDTDFRSWYTALLAHSDLEAFFWEHPPLTNRSIHDPAEFVLLDGPSLLHMRPDPYPFAGKFENVQDNVITFPNLGADALLVVPCPLMDHAAYPHLAVFLREAPVDQIHDLWVQTARAVHDRLSDQSMWVSTAGMGVAWLHIRLDSWPKYYRFDPYKIG